MLSLSLIAERAFIAVDALAAPVPVTQAEVLKRIRQQLQSRSGANFEKLLADWGASYSTRAVEPLFTMARDSSLPDTDRYVALMGGAKLGGATTHKLILPLLKDKVWMIRSGALRALSAIQAREAAGATLPLLKDPALVVRLEAVQTIAQLRPAASVDALIGAARDPINFHRGKAQWVPQKAIATVAQLGNREDAPKLRPLLDIQDSEVQSATVRALERLTGTTLKKRGPLAHQVAAWKSQLRH